MPNYQIPQEQKSSRRLKIWCAQYQYGSLSGVIVKRGSGQIDLDDGSIGTFRKIVGSYLRKPISKKEFKLHGQDFEVDFTTDKNGFFKVGVESSILQKGYFISRKNKALRMKGEVWEGSKKRPDLVVISDIDDTVLISKSAETLSKLWLLLFHSASKRKAVRENQQALKALERFASSFHYVSSSEYNLYHLLRSFFSLNNLPEGQLHLRPYRNYKQLLTPREKHLSYKLNSILNIIDQLKSQSLVLFGDDSQQDLETYLEVAKRFPEEVTAIFLRKTRLIGLEREREIEKAIEEQSEHVYYYEDYHEIEKPIKALENACSTDS